MTAMKYYIKSEGKNPKEVTAKKYWSLARNKNNYTDSYFEKGIKTTRVLTIKN